MGAIYLTSLADVLRAAGLNVIEQRDWQFRSRSSGGFDQNPYAVFWHHTASSTSAESDTEYMSFNADARPIANIYIAENADVWVLAGGATNTNGKGDGGKQFSRGYVPDDAANSHVLGMEIANNGVGETYSAAQLDAAFTASNAINAHLGNTPRDVDTHWSYAPGRKVDPATADAAGAGGWNPGSVNSSGSWNRESLLNECDRRAGGGGTPPPQPPPQPPSYDPPSDWGGFNTDCNKPLIREGDSNQFVRYFQDAMFWAMGYDIIRDGDFGPQTKGFAQQFQRAVGTDDDGTVGWNGSNCQNQGQYQTWGHVDGVVNAYVPPTPEPPPVEPPPITPPPVDGNVRTPDAWYYVQSGDSPWGAAERIWGDGTRGGELDPAMFLQPFVWWRVPGVPGTERTVDGGDSPWSLTEKLGGNPGTDLDVFYDFNGGESKVPQPGERSYLPDDR